MKKYLLPQNGNFYKANLHCHTTVSDGKKTPEEVKDIYVRHGYSVVAYTDHNVMIPHHDLKDDNFLPLTAYEINVNEPGYPAKDKKTCHLCFIYPKPDENPVQNIFTSSYLKKATLEWGAKVNRGENPQEYEREYTAECINDIIRRGREDGYFVTYNHPSWSRENFRDYMSYEGMYAMEIVNYSCLTVGYNDYNDRVYDDMLRGGKRIFCVATDDNHDKFPEGTPFFDSCGGWTMIKADSLDYESIVNALKAGNFYASMGPSIKELWFEDGKVHIECSPVAEINVICGKRYAKRAATPNELITSAEFEITKDAGWFRLDLVDYTGKHADTNAFFTDELPYPEE